MQRLSVAVQTGNAVSVLGSLGFPDSNDDYWKQFSFAVVIVVIILIVI